MARNEQTSHIDKDIRIKTRRDMLSESSRAPNKEGNKGTREPYTITTDDSKKEPEKNNFGTKGLQTGLLKVCSPCHFYYNLSLDE